MDFHLDQVIISALNLPDLDNFELSALYDPPSPTSSSSDCSPLNSPITLTGDDSSSCASSSPASSPLPSTSDSGSSGSSPLHSKHRSRCRTPHCAKKEHVSIQRRNERERNRVKLVSDGFANLRKHVPTTPVNKKLSKVETLRTAIEYIKYLQRVLNESKRLERERRLMQQVGWLEGQHSYQVRYDNTAHMKHVLLATENENNTWNRRVLKWVPKSQIIKWIVVGCAQLKLSVISIETKQDDLHHHWLIAWAHWNCSEARTLRRASLWREIAACVTCKGPCPSDWKRQEWIIRMQRYPAADRSILSYLTIVTDSGT